MIVRVLRVHRVRIDRLEGIPRGSGFEVRGLSPDINLIHGPNGVGKSLLGRSLHALIWPREPGLCRPTISGEWTLDDRVWLVDLDAGHPTTICDGAPTHPDGLPSNETRGHHWLGLRELLDTGEAGARENKGFAERIAREMLGGYDLEAVAKERGYRLPPKRLESADKLREAKRLLADAQAHEREVYKSGESLATLAERRDRAREAGEESRRLSRALEYLDARDEVERCRAALAEYDERVQSLSGDERERLDDVKSELGRARGARADADRAWTEADRTASGCRLGDEGVASALLRTAAEDLRRVQEHRAAAHAAADALANARGRADSFAARVAASVSRSDLEAIGSVPKPEMLSFARERARLRARKAHAEELGRALESAQRDLRAREPNAAGYRVEQVEAGIDTLARWLRATGAPGDSGSVPRVSLLLAGLVIGLLGSVLAMTQHPAWSLALLAATVFAWLGRPARSRSAAGDAGTRAIRERDYIEMGLPEPAEWTAEAVSDLLSRLVSLASACAAAEQRARELESLQEEITRAEADLATRRESLIASLGFPIDDHSDDWLHVLGQNLAEWQIAAAEAEGQRAALEQRHANEAEALGRFNRRLAGLIAEAVDAEDAAGKLNDLESRSSAFDRAMHARESARRDRLSADGEIKRLTQRIRDSLEHLGLTEETELELDRWLAELPDCRAATQELAEGEARLAALRRDLGEEYVALGWDRARIESERDARLADHERYAQLEQEIGRITERVERAKEEHRVEEIREEVSELRADVVEDLRGAQRAVAGLAIVEWLREEAASRTQPAVLRHAADFFSRVTRGRYDLRVSGSQRDAGFEAYDTREGVCKSLDELSAGERVQLLVAVRLGFLEHQRSDVRLPLVLDETLGTTDDDRAGAMIEAVIEICRSGRQVFYFTAQRDEVGKWIAALRDLEDISFRDFDLGQIRAAAESESVPLRIDRPADAPLPDPGDLSHEEYGHALGVPGMDPRRDVGGVHVWHLVDETAVVHELIQKRVDRVGPFLRYVAGGSISIPGLDHGACRRLRVRADALGVAFEAWRIGRGKPVDRQVFTRWSGTKENMIEKLTKKAAEVGGDAERLLLALKKREVPYWHSPKTEELERYLEEEGYLDRETELDPDEIFRRALQHAARTSPAIELDTRWLERVIASLPRA